MAIVNILLETNKELLTDRELTDIAYWGTINDVLYYCMTETSKYYFALSEYKNIQAVCLDIHPTITIIKSIYELRLA